MPDPHTTQEMWTRYDALMRQGGDLSTAEKTELQRLRAALILAGIVIESKDF